MSWVFNYGWIGGINFVDRCDMLMLVVVVGSFYLVVKMLLCFFFWWWFSFCRLGNFVDCYNCLFYIVDWLMVLLV